MKDHLWKKGVSGNPGGRPKANHDVRNLAREHTALAIQTLADACKRGSISAAVALLNRGYGLPEVNVEFRMLLEKRISEMNESELLQLQERIAGLAINATPVIEYRTDDKS